MMLDDADEHVHCFPIRSGRPRRPEEGLAIAVLEDAIRTLQRCVVADERAARVLVAEVDEWFACDDTDHPFAFVSICDVLALDVAYMRSGLRHWRGRQTALLTEAPAPHCIGRRRLREQIIPSRPLAARHTSRALVAARSSTMDSAANRRSKRAAGQSTR